MYILSWTFLLNLNNARRFKGAIQQTQAEAENRFGANSSRMSSNLIYHTQVEVFCQWQILAKTRMDRNCREYSNTFSAAINFFLSFITYRSCKHLDNKHTIFGRVVGGMETLSEMERIEVDNKDKPIEDIVILKTQVFVDPYEEADEQVAIKNYFCEVKWVMEAFAFS